MGTFLKEAIKTVGRRTGSWSVHGPQRPQCPAQDARGQAAGERMNEQKTPHVRPDFGADRNPVYLGRPKLSPVSMQLPVWSTRHPIRLVLLCWVFFHSMVHTLLKGFSFIPMYFSLYNFQKFKIGDKKNKLLSRDASPGCHLQTILLDDSTATALQSLCGVRRPRTFGHSLGL